MEKAIFQLRYLFIDDPLSYNSDGDENSDFCAVYDLGFQWRIFYQLCKEKVGIKVKKDNEEIQGVRQQEETSPSASPVNFAQRVAHDNGMPKSWFRQNWR